MTQPDEHTAGPWRVVAADDYEIHSDATPEVYPHRCKGDDLGRFVALVGNRGALHGEADARLIAAAPDLLEALKDAREKMWTYGFSEDDLQPIRRAISKAEGEHQ